MLELQKFILENLEDWEEKLNKAPYYLTIKRKDGYILFKYNQIKSDFSYELVREARGIILDEKTFQTACVPFFKFFNYGEPNCAEIEWLSGVQVFEKIDGSLIKIWYSYKNKKWMVSSNGLIDANDAILQSGKTLYELFVEALKTAGLNKEGFFRMLSKSFTYMFELVSPYNQIVIPYKETKLYFLLMRDNFDLDEMNYCNSPFSQFESPKKFNLKTLEDIEEAAKALPWDEEGYVVIDKYYNRCKIKSPEYVKVHYMGQNKTPSLKFILNASFSGEKDEILSYYPEYKDLFLSAESAYNLAKMQFKYAQSNVNFFKEQNPEATSKEFYFNYYNKVDSWLLSLMCKSFRSGVPVEQLTSNWDIDKWVKILKEDYELLKKVD